MLKIENLDKNISKIFELESFGYEPEKIIIDIPSITEPDIPFTIKIALIDRNEYPSFKFDEIIVLKSEELNIEIPVKFKKNRPAIAFIKNFLINYEGFFKFYCEFNGKVFYSNPSLSRKNNTYKIFWGDPHVHTVLSDCHPDIAKSVHFAINYGNFVSFLNWISITDHISNRRSTLGKWKEGIYVSKFYNKEGEFIILPGYEASLKSFNGGDNNVYFTNYPDIFVDEFEQGNIKTLCKKLKEKSKIQNFDFFVVPHHTSRAQKHGEINEDIYPGQIYMPAIEIHSKWGTSEYYGNPDSLIEPYNGEGYAVDYLKKGFYVGFIGGSDTHKTMPANNEKETSHLIYQSGLTAVFNDFLNIKNLFESIRNRKTYATKGEKIFLEVKVNNILSGTIFDLDKKDKVKISVISASPYLIKNIEIIRNGEIIYQKNLNNWYDKTDYVDEVNFKNDYLESETFGKFVFYYVRVNTSSNSCAWSSPVFIKLN
ncbi:MAG: hypothetical protein ACK4F0_06705 [Candidatus Ratteibacteria bacterium]